MHFSIMSPLQSIYIEHGIISIGINIIFNSQQCNKIEPAYQNTQCVNTLSIFTYSVFCMLKKYFFSLLFPLFIHSVSLPVSYSLYYLGNPYKKGALASQALFKQTPATSATVIKKMNNIID